MFKSTYMAQGKKEMTKQELIELSDKLYEEDKYNDVIELLDDDTLAKHNSEELYTNRGRAYWKNDELDKAYADCETAISINNEYAPAYRCRGVVWGEKGEYDKGIADYNKAIELKPDDDIAYNNRGNAWYNKGEYDKAIADYNKAIELNPDYDKAYRNRGDNWYAKEEYEKALADYNQVIELKPDDSSAYNNRGNTWSRKGEYDKAIADYNKAIRFKPDYDKGHYNRGNIWGLKGELEKAITDYNKAIKINPNHARAYNNRGRSWHKKEEYEKAITDFEKSIELDSDRSTYWLDRAKEKRDEEKALQGKKLETTSDDAIAPIHLFKKILTDAALEDKDISKILKTSAEAKTEGVDKVREFAAKAVDKIVSDNLVAHYTKLFVADIIVSNEDSPHRFYNAVYMNDPEEGRVLLDCMDSEIIDCFENASKLEEDNIYIGSYLPAPEHEDELVMWRTYGKDLDGNEAKGCSIVIDTKFFDVYDGKKVSALNPDMHDDAGKSIHAHQSLYSVLYYDKKDRSFICEGAETLEEYLKTFQNKLKKLIRLKVKDGIKPYSSNKNMAIDSIIYHLVSEIRFFFKRSDYSFENEVRVIRFATKTSKDLQIDDAGLPRKVFLTSKKDVKPYIEKIFLGPKVANPKQWLYLEVAMKKHGYDIQVLQSETKYQ